MKMVRSEFKRVIQFAKGLGLEVKIVSKPSDFHGHYAEPCLEGSGVITIVKSGKTTLTFQLATLLHEIGHHLDFTENKIAIEAYHFIEGSSDKKAPEWARKAIYNSERRAIQNAEKLYWTLMLKVPYWRIRQEFEVDLYLYSVFLRTADFPLEEELVKFRKHWARRHKKQFSINAKQAILAAHDED